MSDCCITEEGKAFPGDLIVPGMHAITVDLATTPKRAGPLFEMESSITDGGTELM